MAGAARPAAEPARADEHPRRVGSCAASRFAGRNRTFNLGRPRCNTDARRRRRDEFHEEAAFLETRTLYLEHGSSLHTGPAFPLHRRHGANEIVRWGERLRILIIVGRLRRSPRIFLNRISIVPIY